MFSGTVALCLHVKIATTQGDNPDLPFLIINGDNEWRLAFERDLDPMQTLKCRNSVRSDLRPIKFAVNEYLQ